MGLFENMSLFENFMMRLGFVRVRRVLEGLRIVKNDAERIGAGYEIFGFKYTDVLEHAIVHGNFDPTRVSLDKAIIAYRKAADAMLGVPPLQPEENPNHRKQEPHIPMPSPARADGKRVKHIAGQRGQIEAMSRHSAILKAVITAGQVNGDTWETTMERAVIDQDRLIGLLYDDLCKYAERFGAVPNKQ
jgi:hypothetical protein